MKVVLQWVRKTALFLIWRLANHHATHTQSFSVKYVLILYLSCYRVSIVYKQIGVLKTAHTNISSANSAATSDFHFELTVSIALKKNRFMLECYASYPKITSCLSMFVFWSIQTFYSTGYFKKNGASWMLSDKGPILYHQVWVWLAAKGRFENLSLLFFFLLFDITSGHVHLDVRWIDQSTSLPSGL